MEIKVVQNIESVLPTFLITNSDVTPMLGDGSANIDKGKTGGGFGDSETNREVEQAAVLYVTNDYHENGWTVESVELKRCGFDLLCTKNKTQEHVEVKGVQGDTLSFIITAGEVKRSQKDENFILCVVTSALTNPKLHKLTAKDFNEGFSLETISYRAVLKQR